MFKKLKKFVKKATQVESFDASRFNDPMALQIEWTPAKPGGSSFRTHKLVKDGYNIIRFEPTIGARIFSGIFVITGVGVMILGAFGIFSETGSAAVSDFLFFIPFGLIFAGAGGFIYYKYSKPIVFDKLTGNYWKGFKEPDHNVVISPDKNSCRLSDIHAIQLLSEYIKSDKSSYYSYELNLVLNDGTRLNVIDHGNKNSIREDALILSNYLGKPVWDAT